jgi:hypothetical protein
LEYIAKAIWQEEEIKRTKIGKEEVKVSLFTDDMILYLKDLKNTTKKLLDTINSFSKLSGYKIKLQKSVAFHIPTTNRLREYRKTIPLMIASKKNT